MQSPNLATNVEEYTTLFSMDFITWFDSRIFYFCLWHQRSACCHPLHGIHWLYFKSKECVVAIKT